VSSLAADRRPREKPERSIGSKDANAEPARIERALRGAWVLCGRSEELIKG
jgi:hypothetical protein